MQHSQQEEIQKIAKQFKVSPEFVEATLWVKQATTMRDKLEGFNRERSLMEQGGPEAVKRRHEKGNLTARERITKLLDQGSFEELDLWHRPYETGFDIDERPLPLNCYIRFSPIYS